MAKRLREDEDMGELNLVPIMGLIVILIPMLLLMVVFTKIGVININAPKLAVGAPSDDQEEPEKKPLNLTVAISEKGYTLAATGGVLPGQEPVVPGAPPAPKTGPTLPTTVTGSCDGPGTEPKALCGDGRVCPKQCGDGNLCRDNQCLAWDYAGLYAKMVEIKGAYPDEGMVNLAADDRVHYGTLVATMDAVRLRLTEDSYDDHTKFQAAEVKKDSDGNPEMLFGDVVMAVAQ